MRKRITSLLLTLVMLLSLVPAMGVTASAEETWETVTTYQQFEAAMTAEGQCSIKLGADIDTAALNRGIGLLGTLAVKGKKQLDLNGHTLRLFTQKDALGDLITVGSNTPTTSVPISATATEYSHTIPAGEAPSVYPFDLQLNLKKGDDTVGIYTNDHIVKLVVNEAPVVEPDPTIDGTVYYTSGIVYGSPISISASVTPAEATKSYQWQRSTDGGSTWTNIEGATSGQYTPVAADMGDTVRIRVVVTAEGYLGEIVGAAVKVSKAANNDYPEVIQLEAVKDSEGNYRDQTAFSHAAI